MRYLPFLIIALAAAALSALALLHAPWWWIGAAPFLLLTALGVWDFVQPSHTLMRNYPVIARIRWLSESLRPFVQSYFVEGDTEGKPFSREERALVYRRSKNIEGVQPFGSELDFRAPDVEWLEHSIAARSGKGANVRLDIGGPQCAQPYSASIYNISAMSFGSLGARAIETLNLGAKLGGFAQDTGEGGISKYHRKHGGDLIWEIGSGYFGCRNRDGGFDPEAFKARAQSDQVRMIEIKLSQGAKPGHGGVLPGSKVTAEIAEARGVEIGEECVSPAAHSAFSTPAEMMEFIAQLRELSGGKPVGFKLCVGRRVELFALMKAMQSTGIQPDFIVVDGKEGGTGAAPAEFMDSVGSPLREGLIAVRDALIGSGYRDTVRIGAAGKVVTGVRFATNIALGADWCNSARGFMFSLGCVQSMLCDTNHCPTGITTHDPLRQRGLVVEDKAKRVAAFHKNTVQALVHMAAAAGCDHPHELRPEHVMRRVGPDRAISLRDLYPQVRSGQFWDDARATPYGREWAAATPDSFNALAPAA
jgi:glutamate synthase domain-containing protein 2